MFCTRDNCQFNERIVDRERYEKELLESKERYKKLVQLFPHAVLVHTGEKFIFVNKAGAKLLEVENRKQLIGAPITKFVPEEYRADLFKDINYIKTKKRKNIGPDVKIVTTTGKIVDVSTSSNIIEYDGEEAIMTILTDITEQKEKERLLVKAEEDKRKINEMVEYDKIKTEFFANISHELRTPINVILGSIQLMSSYSEDLLLDPNKLNKLNRTMKQNCFRLLRLINNLIDITKIDSGYYKLNLENTNIVKVVEDITLSVANYVENKGIELIFDTNIEEKIIAVDPDKIERIILNLLSNAIKFTSKGDRIKVTVWDKDEDVVIEVEDTGIGVPEDQREIIFERFRQVDKLLTRNHEGSGIGLSLVKSLLEMHGGSIELQSTYGEGSNFIIRIPCIKISESDEVDLESIAQRNKQEVKNIEKIRIEFSDIYL